MIDASNFEAAWANAKGLAEAFLANKDYYVALGAYEKSTSPKEGGKADYAFSLAPFYTRVRFLVEAKRPQANILTPDNCFQLIRYG
jgi:hypothetical protein